jgi:integron integrase
MAEPAPPPRLLDRVRAAVRARHFSRRTEKAYVGWIRRFILLHDKRHPSEMGGPEVSKFLSALAMERGVAASTQNQALSALLFLYKEVLGQALPWLDDVVRAKRPARLPVVLSRGEVLATIRHIDGTPRLMALLLYGAGLRLLECARLRVKDVDFARHRLIVRGGKGDKDRMVPLPAVVAGDLTRHLEAVKRQHEEDLGRGAGWVELPGALGRKYPHAAREWAWPPASTSIARVASGAATTCTSPCSSARLSWPSARRASPSTPPVTPSVIPSPRISSRTAPTSARCRSSWATATSAPR